MLIAQITDTHVTGDVTGLAARSLTQCIAWINALQPAADVVLLTGDTTNTGAAAQYAVLRGILAHCTSMVYVVPGNHDRRERLRAGLPSAYFPGVSGERLNYAIENVAVRLIGVDSTEPRHLGGFVNDASLTWFERALTQAPLRPTLVFMHHPPFRTGVNAADLFGFRGEARFREIVLAHPGVRRIIAGHVHCERRATLGTALATTGISTRPQRVPEVFERRLVGLRAEPAGLTLHAWTNDTFTSTTYTQTGDGRFAHRPPG